MTRIVVFTDEPMSAMSLATVLAAEDGFVLVGVVDRPTEITRIIDIEKANLLLVDLAGGVPVSQLEEVRRRAPWCKVVCWTRSFPIKTALHLLELGVQGILPKTAARHFLCSSLRRIAGGEQCIDDSLFFLELPESVKLTSREQRIIHLVSLGMKNKEMASALSISQGTLKVYLSRLLQKTGLRDRYQLALYGQKKVGGQETAPRDASLSTHTLTLGPRNLRQGATRRPADGTLQETP